MKKLKLIEIIDRPVETGLQDRRSWPFWEKGEKAGKNRFLCDGLSATSYNEPMKQMHAYLGQNRRNQRSKWSSRVLVFNKNNFKFIL
jgi:hypothetical protein